MENIFSIIFSLFIIVMIIVSKTGVFAKKNTRVKNISRRQNGIPKRTDLKKDNVQRESVSVPDDDEYKALESYKTDEKPYYDDTAEKAYEFAGDGVGLNDLQKAIVISEIIGKPKSLRRN